MPHSRLVKLPFSNSTIHAHTGKVKMNGSGAGGVLLRTGGGGAGSSYMDIDDYIHTTGIDPYKRAGISRPQGKGLSSLGSKLSSLNAKPVGSVRKNIVMNI